jgi:hypothetical protein
MARIDTTIAFNALDALAADLVYEARLGLDEAATLAPAVLAHLRAAWSAHEADGTRVARAGEWSITARTGDPKITLLVSVWGEEGEATEQTITLPRAASPLALAVETARAALAAAYGGFSQFGSPEMAKSIAGHHRNGGVLACFPVDDLVREFAAQDARQWSDCGAETVAAEIRAAL